MSLERKKTLNVFREAKKAWGSYDEFPIGPNGTDPMPHLSRNRIRQPFFVVSEEDQVLIQMSGRAVLELREGEPSRMDLEPGDAVYIPARTPSRVVPRGEAVQVRLKAEPPGREAVAWYCDACGALVHARELEPGIVQERWQEAVEAWNADPSARTCACGSVNPPAPLGDIAWREVAAALRSED